jgi:hypothetical protein
MTTTANAIKKLQKEGATIIRQNAFHTIAQLPAAKIEVIDQDGEAISIYVIKTSALYDAVTTDYFAGHFRPNIKQAIELARRMESW